MKIIGVDLHTRQQTIAMKMQNEIRSPKSGKIEKLFAQEGQPVNAGEVLLWVE